MWTSPARWIGTTLAALALSGAAQARPVATLYGAAGSFGAAAAATTLPTGESFAAHAVPGWGFRPGQAAYFTAIGPDGTVLVANEPQTDNQLRPTAREMVVSSFDPATDRFTNVQLPTSAGDLAVGGPWPDASGVVGGADVADVQPVEVDGATRLAVLSAVPYHGWDLSRHGTFPTLGYLSQEAGGWAADPGRSVTAAQVQTGDGAPACQPQINAAWEPFGDCHLPAELALLPRSGNLVMTQYLPEHDSGRTSGEVAVLTPGGQVRASVRIPDVRLPDGQVLGVHPREVDADPRGAPGDERFVVIYDAVLGEGTAHTGLSPFAMQEFRFDAAAGTVAPVSAPVVSGMSADGDALGFETAQYDRDGDLWAAQSVVGTLRGGPLAVYEREAGGTLERCGGATWGTTCKPSDAVGEAAGVGIVRSLTPLPGGAGMAAATLSGWLLPIAEGREGPVAGRVMDLGLGRVTDRTATSTGPRKGVVDPRTGTLWLPIQQLETSRTCAAWPCEPRALDQWLLAIDLDGLGPLAPPVVTRAGGAIVVRGRPGADARLRAIFQRRAHDRWHTLLKARLEARRHWRVRRHVAHGRWRVRLESRTARSAWVTVRVR